MTKSENAELSIIIVSYNTRELTLKCLETLYQNTKHTNFEVILWDNDSHDGSADAVAAAYPQVKLVRCEENLGFAKANNLAAENVSSEWLLLLNPDTETHPGAIDNLLEFSKKHPEAGITGGRTVFPDGSLNIASCWMKITPWSMFCHAFGLTAIFPNSPLFNTEAIGGWKRDTVRKVDIVSGCFFMLKTDLWREFGGFNLKYVMYGEEADLCLRAQKEGYQPMITPDAQIMHLVGASTKNRADKTVLVSKARISLIKDHWSSVSAPIGLLLFFCWITVRKFAALLTFKKQSQWHEVWKQKTSWLKGY
ncbi:glycosyltransferase [Sneathiella sp. P13V-1]|uniref:glycosyltransferase family 2 protein n=1 Tax=Sneathiella sp. P13V-1 TaxID=2697366 RepID=UPI00187BAE26|nr:glycosyltransferase family 2 protein [Sneathiella sp. P13V-1]MBE7636402.1 glycosyltransferase [Sneathiella sp. P13V-1]